MSQGVFSESEAQPLEEEIFDFVIKNVYTSGRRTPSSTHWNSPCKSKSVILPEFVENQQYVFENKLILNVSNDTMTVFDTLKYQLQRINWLKPAFI